MAMNRFAYASAHSVEEALEVLGDGCRPLAGGTDLLAMLKEGLIAPSSLVDLKRVPEMSGVCVQGGMFHIGALTPLSHLLADPDIGERESMSCLYGALLHTASPQIRHMATIGGNLLQRPRCWYFRNKLTHCLRKGGRTCFAFRGENKYHAVLGGGPCYIVHPSDPAVALLALDASVVVTGSTGARTVPLGDFYLLPRHDPHREVALASDELLAEILVPVPADSVRGTYLKVAERGAWDFATASVAVQLAFSGETVRRARVALGGAAPVPWRARDAEEALLGASLSDEAIAQAARAATAGARPLAQNGYKIDLIQGVVRQALRRLR